MRIALLATALALTLFGFQEPKPVEKAPLKVDSSAPVFRLNDNTGQIVTIGGEQENWTVLAFYPKAMTPG